jgi:hypothetical protein
MIDTIKYLGLLKLPRKLDPDNYVAWKTTIESALRMQRLFEYVSGDIPEPTDSDELINWQCANELVRTILTSNMADEVVNQVGHFPTASEIWDETKRLYLGQTVTDWTLIITSLVTSRYVDGEDLNTHIAKMKSYRCDLIMMDRKLPDDLFACFLRISMPSSWNYVFAGLPAVYSAAEVEHRIKDEHGVRANQESIASAYHTLCPIDR